MINKKITLSLSNFLLTIIFSMFFASLSINAQDSSVICKEKTVWREQPVSRYNELLNQYETFMELVETRVTECTPSTQEKKNQTSTKESPYPNTVRNPDGTIKPAEGYKWVNPQKENDFRVERINSMKVGKFKLSSEPPSESVLGEINGIWLGTYTCGQGITNLNLSISHIIFWSDIDAVFKFYANKNNPSVPSGSYRMKGTYDYKTQKVILNASSWINRPSGYTTVNLVGYLSEDKSQISGIVNNRNCSTFTLTKKR